MKTINDYVEAYNEVAKQIGANPVKRFPSVAVAKKRLAEMKASARRCNLEPRDFTVEEPRPNTLIAAVLPVLRRGATLGELQSVVGKYLKSAGKKVGDLEARTIRTVYNIHYHYGFGIKNSGGRLRAYTA